jgi:hypothetical protein
MTIAPYQDQKVGGSNPSRHELAECFSTPKKAPLKF